MTTYVIPLPWSKPPLSLNQRWRHWTMEAKAKKEVRQAAHVLARSHKVGSHEHVTVQLVYQPRDRRRRDPSNIIATQKPLLDGLVDAGVVPDDTPEFVTETIPRIEEPVKGEPGKMWLEIRV